MQTLLTAVALSAALQSQVAQPVAQPLAVGELAPKLEAVTPDGASVVEDWSKGDVVELSLPMPVRRVVADERVKDDAGRVALERGPIVFCAEGVDQKDHRVLDLVLADDTPLKQAKM